jgi:hypothetical protein
MGEVKNTEAVETFIRRWQGREGGQERANYVSFLNELIALLGLPAPDPADATHEHNDYVFERAVKKHKDEGDSHGRIDLYKKNSLVLEAKQSRLKTVWSWHPLLVSSRRRHVGPTGRGHAVNSPMTVTRRIRRRGERGISR